MLSNLISLTILFSTSSAMLPLRPKEVPIGVMESFMKKSAEVIRVDVEKSMTREGKGLKVKKAIEAFMTKPEFTAELWDTYRADLRSKVIVRLPGLNYPGENWHRTNHGMQIQ